MTQQFTLPPHTLFYLSTPYSNSTSPPHLTSTHLTSFHVNTFRLKFHLISFYSQHLVSFSSQLTSHQTPYLISPQYTSFCLNMLHFVLLHLALFQSTLLYHRTPHFTSTHIQHTFVVTLPWNTSHRYSSALILPHLTFFYLISYIVLRTLPYFWHLNLLFTLARKLS